MQHIEALSRTCYPTLYDVISASKDTTQHHHDTPYQQTNGWESYYLPLSKDMCIQHETLYTCLQRSKLKEAKCQAEVDATSYSKVLLLDTHVTCTVLVNHTINHTCEWESSTATTVAGNSTSVPKYKARYYLTPSDPEPTPCPSQLHICHVCQSTETCTSTLICKEPHDVTPASKDTTQHCHDKTYDQKIDWESYFLSLTMNMQEPKLGNTNYMTDVIVTIVMFVQTLQYIGGAARVHQWQYRHALDPVALLLLHAYCKSQTMKKIFQNMADLLLQCCIVL